MSKITSKSMSKGTIYALICCFVLSLFYLSANKKTYNPDLLLLGDNAFYYIGGKSMNQGQGYMAVSKKKPTYSSHYPPGYPFIISLLLDNESVEDDIKTLKDVNSYFFLLAIIMALLLIVYFNHEDLPEGTSYIMAFFIALMLALNGHIQYYASAIMSEASFTLFTFLALFGLTKWSERKDFYKSPYFYVSLLSASFAYYIRTFGIAILATFILYAIIRKKWKVAGIWSLWSVIIYLPWSIRNSIHGVGKTNSQAFWSVNYWRPEEGTIGVGDLFQRITENIVRFVEKEIPSVFFPNLNINYSMEASGYVLTGLFLTAFIILGIVVTKRFRMLIVSFLICYFGMLLITPSSFYGIRYFLPITPILFYCFFKGLFFGIDWGISKAMKKAPGNFVKYAVAIIPLFLLIDYAQVSNTSPQSDSIYLQKLTNLSIQRDNGRPRNWKNYFRVAAWSKKKIGKDAVVMTTKPGLFFLYSDHFTAGIPSQTDTRKMLDVLDEQEVTHVVIDQLGFSRTFRYLYPAINTHPEKFEPIHQLGNNNSRDVAVIFKYHPDKGYDGEWKDGKRQGKGTYTWRNGMSYTGSWLDNKRHGEGTMNYPDRTYTGNWTNDKENGAGTLTFKNGRVIEGIWENGAVKEVIKDTPPNE